MVIEDREIPRLLCSLRIDAHLTLTDPPLQRLQIDGGLRCTFGYTSGRAPRIPAFRTGLEAELARMRAFLGMG